MAEGAATEPRSFLLDAAAFRASQLARESRSPFAPINAYRESERLQTKWAEGWLSVYHQEERAGEV
jgi:hypothetical protein